MGKKRGGFGESGELLGESKGPFRIWVTVPKREKRGGFRKKIFQKFFFLLLKIFDWKKEKKGPGFLEKKESKIWEKKKKGLAPRAGKGKSASGTM